MVLHGKAILIFGSDSDINKKILDGITKNNPSTVFFISPNESGSEERDGIDYFLSNYYDWDNLESLLEGLTHKKFDGIVYAGGTGGVRPLKLNTPEFVDKMFHHNVFTFFEIIRLMTWKRMINPGASIVALSSVSSIKGLKSKSVYSASKAALDAAVRGMAAELCDKKIRVNSIQKGWVTSDMNLDFIQNNMAVSESNDFQKQLLGAITPEEIGNLVVFLLSDQVMTLTGTNLLLDGGYSL